MKKIIAENEAKKKRKVFCINTLYQTIDLSYLTSECDQNNSSFILSMLPISSVCAQA